MVAPLLVAALAAAGCGGSNASDPADGAGGTSAAPPASESTSTPTGDGAPDTPDGATAEPSERDPDAAGSGSADPDPPASPMPGEDGAPDPVPATPDPQPAPTEPLTGEPLDNPSIMNRPALAIKVGTSSVGRPQTGINQADMLIEARVEGITRLMAVFHSQGAEPLGPVRSARSSDPDILANFGQPIYGHSGANPGVLREISQGQADGKLYELRWDNLPTDYWRVRDRVPPWNLYTTTAAIWDAAPGRLEAPAPLFEYRRPGESLPPSAQPVPGVEVRYLSSSGGLGLLAQFAWDGESGGWARWQDGTPHVDMARHTDGTPNPDIAPVQVAPANVVVLQTRYTGSAADPRSPEAITVDPNGGVALVFTAGHLIRGQWTRPSAGQPWQVADGDGNPVRLTPGQTFIALPGGDVLVMVEDFAENLLKKR
ncbi:DUF3048 domain-containing protein [Candidatus Poriferisocius sp.]|uniref:DUF3048 domain-containing protein n=1 Tax=Candidatus Poriferisocius sp. TaxID=3101276 RepID=UPI003B018B99